MKVIIHADGGSRGNPGPSAAGIILKDTQGQTLVARGFFLDHATNNVAEYTGVLRALEHAHLLGATSVVLYSDSELLVKQLLGEYAVRSPNIKPLYEEVTTRLNQFQDWEAIHVLRNHNKHADRLVNRALDAQIDINESPADTASASAPPLRLGALISGGGRTLLNLLACQQRGELNIEVPIVISSRSTVAGVERSREAGLTVEIVRKKDFATIEDFSARLEALLTKAQVDLVVQAGWLCLWKIPPHYNNRVMNIHPALLPSFGGRGMWGHHVHEAVLEAGCKISGCTVHFCTDEYDRGPIIVQRCCPVLEDDDADSLAARVFEQECLALPQAVRLFAEQRLHVAAGRVEIRNASTAVSGS